MVSAEGSKVTKVKVTWPEMKRLMCVHVADRQFPIRQRRSVVTATFRCPGISPTICTTANTWSISACTPTISSSINSSSLRRKWCLLNSMRLTVKDVGPSRQGTSRTRATLRLNCSTLSWSAVGCTARWTCQPSKDRTSSREQSFTAWPSGRHSRRSMYWQPVMLTRTWPSRPRPGPRTELHNEFRGQSFTAWPSGRHSHHSVYWQPVMLTRTWPSRPRPGPRTELHNEFKGTIIHSLAFRSAQSFNVLTTSDVNKDLTLKAEARIKDWTSQWVQRNNHSQPGLQVGTVVVQCIDNQWC